MVIFINIFDGVTVLALVLENNFCYNTIHICVCNFGAVLTYRIEMHTGNLPDAGTDANVHLMLIGERGDTGYRQLLKPLSTDLSRPYQRGQVTTLCELKAIFMMSSSLFYLTESYSGDNMPMYSVW